MGKIDLIGQRFGKLIVIDRAESKNGRGMWLCQCDCGGTKITRTDALKDGRTKSCGCLHKEYLYNKNKKDLIGQTFGKLTVLKETDEREPNTRNIMWECKCECGRKILVPSRNLISGHTKSCGCLKSQGEYNIGKILNEHNILFEKEKTFDTCIFEDTGRKAKFDFYVNNQYIIEFDGKQHFFNSGSGWFTEEAHQKTINHDKIKNKWCIENNIPLIRIPYTHLNNITFDDLIPSTSIFLYQNKL